MIQIIIIYDHILSYIHMWITILPLHPAVSKLKCPGEAFQKAELLAKEAPFHDRLGRHDGCSFQDGYPNNLYIYIIYNIYNIYI